MIDSFPEFLTPEEVGKILRLSRSTISRYLKAGEFTGAIHIGRQWRIPRAAVEAMLGMEREPNERAGMRCGKQSRDEEEFCP